MRKVHVCVLCALMVVAGCTEPGETTGIGAATGGALGAGLGAIVGSQTGDPGTGLVLGAVAGASAGGLVGNALQAQNEPIRSQDEAIERQEKTITAQRSEIQELRRLSQDNVSFKRSDGRTQESARFGLRPGGTRRLAPSVPGRKVVAPIQPRIIGAQTAVTHAKPTTPIREKDLVQSAYTAPLQRDDFREPISGSSVAAIDDSSTSRNSAPAKGGSGAHEPECSRAAEEVRKVAAAQDTADRLFHYRRALRLCPQNSAYHLGLGDVYASLNRPEDARFEYAEALKLDPKLSSARAKLKALEGGRY